MRHTPNFGGEHFIMELFLGYESWTRSRHRSERKNTSSQEL
jgi:hypothetical protein